jgi:hypothetical protein
LETINMMNKYQYIFLRMETALKKLNKLFDSKIDIFKLKKSFNIMKEKAQVFQKAKKC